MLSQNSMQLTLAIYKPAEAQNDGDRRRVETSLMPWPKLRNQRIETSLVP